ncbi:hypothetical protein ACIP5Y_04200 [Nocardia sp. NPDC088792]|uniref:hypothetical protein n=1 Tax=Nocardia sp. NPDC088792 TaxID=3364332 RepID=UPI00382F0348
MDTSTIRRATGTAAALGAVCILVELPLYFVYSGPPPASNVLTRSLFGLAGLACLVVFMTLFGQLVKRIDPEQEWIGALASKTGSLWITMLFVGTGLEAGAVIQSTTAIDPTITVSGTYIIYGSIARLLEGMFLVAFGFAVRHTGLLPKWSATSAWILAAINFAFIPSIFFGNTPANFYAANGLGTTATMGGLTMLWFLIIGLTLARKNAGPYGESNDSKVTAKVTGVSSTRAVR